MIRLHSFVGVDPDVTALPAFKKFLRHYAELGVTEFVLDFHTNTDDFARVAQFSDAARAFRCTVRNVISEPYLATGNHLHHVNAFIRDYCSAGDWCLMADTDEFIKFPVPIQEFLDARDAAGDRVLVGHLIDRISGEGTFPEITERSELDDLFPFQYPLTLLVRGGWTRKVVALKAMSETTAGRHALVDEGPSAAAAEHAFLRRVYRTGIPLFVRCVRPLYPWIARRRSALPRWRGRVEVHHFAWDHLRHAKMMALRSDFRCEYPSEVENVLRFLDAPLPLTLLDMAFLRRMTKRE